MAACSCTTLSEPSSPKELGKMESPFEHACFNNVFVSGAYAYYAGSTSTPHGGRCLDCFRLTWLYEYGKLT